MGQALHNFIAIPMIIISVGVLFGIIYDFVASHIRLKRMEEREKAFELVIKLRIKLFKLSIIGPDYRGAPASRQVSEFISRMRKYKHVKKRW